MNIEADWKCNGYLGLNYDLYIKLILLLSFRFENIDICDASNLAYLHVDLEEECIFYATFL